MKKTGTFCLLVCVLLGALLFPACAEDAEVAERVNYNTVNGSAMIQTDGQMLYFCHNRTIQKLNPATGQITFVCTDPLCEHLPSCSLGGVAYYHPFYVNNNRLWYRRVYSEQVKKGVWEHIDEDVSYDMGKKKLTLIQKHEPNTESYAYIRQLFTEDYRFFYDYSYDEEKEQGLFVLCREDLHSGEIVELDSETNTGNIVTERFVFTREDRIYFTDGRRLFSRTTDNLDEREHCTGTFPGIVCTDGTAVYYEVEGANGMDVYRLESANDSTGGVRIIADCYSWFFAADGIYYADSEKRFFEKQQTTGEGEPELCLIGKEIRRYTHTGEDELVFSYTGEWAKYQLEGMTVLDNGIYGYYSYYDDANGNVEYVQEIFHINTDTGEAEIIPQDVK